MTTQQGPQTQQHYIRRSEEEVGELEELSAVLDKEDVGLKQPIQLDVKLRVIAVRVSIKRDRLRVCVCVVRARSKNNDQKNKSR